MYAFSNAMQPGGAVVHRIHRRDDRQQHLCGANVGRRLLAANVLLSRLQSQSIRSASLAVDRDTDEAAGKRALERVARRHEGRVRATEAHGHAESLCRPDHAIGAGATRRLQ